MNVWVSARAWRKLLRDGRATMTLYDDVPLGSIEYVRLDIREAHGEPEP